MRELEARRNVNDDELVGFGCSGCGWLFPIYNDEYRDEAPPSVELVVNTFKGHDCGDYRIARAA